MFFLGNIDFDAEFLADLQQKINVHYLESNMV